MSSFRHVVTMRWTPDATEAQIQAVIDGLAGLPSVIPQIVRYQMGRDAGINDGNHDFVVVADFADIDGYLAYRDHPEHLSVLKERIRPILLERAAVQYTLRQ